MTSLRVLALAAGAAGLAVAAVAGLVPAQRSPRPQRAVPAAAFTSPSTSTTTSTTTTTATATGTATTTTPSDATARGGSPAPDLRDVPASILSRAAAARALDRKAGAACRPLVTSGASCAPQRDTLEIQWDVGKDP